MRGRTVFLVLFAMLTASVLNAQSNTKIVDFETGTTSAGLKIGLYNDKPMNGTSVIKVKPVEGPAGHGIRLA